jgi:pimeloyl-ACP methyl ester carboxylesterase
MKVAANNHHYEQVEFYRDTFYGIFIYKHLHAQEPVAPNGKFVSVNGAKIYYEENGIGDPLILMHGFGRTAADWKPFVEAFSKKFRVIAWDMRGHGRSTNSDTSEVFLHATAARDLLTFIEVLKLEKVKLIGHSSGGIVALYAATMQPSAIEAIVPISAQAYFGDSVRSFIKRNAVPEAYYEFMGLSKLHGEQKGRLIARQFFHFHKLQGDPLIIPEQLSKIKSRTFVVHGDNDFVPVSQAWVMFQNIPGAHLLIIPNGWHEPHRGEENKNDFIRRVLEFLSGEWDKAKFPK